MAEQQERDGTEFLAALMPPDSPQASMCAEAAQARGVQWLGARPELEDFSDEDLGKVTILAAGYKLNSAKLAKNWGRLPNLKWFQTWSAGVEKIFPCEVLSQSNVLMCNASGAYTDIIAEYVMAAMLYFDKELHRREASRRCKKWDKFELPCNTGEKTFGVIGIGDIGSASARLAKAFGMRVVATRRRPELADPYVDKMFPLSELLEMLAECDYVCMCTPWTPATDKMISRAHFDAMKATAVFINVGRGKCVDEEALLAALASDSIRGAALDVTAEEPVPQDWAGYEMEGKVLMSCHSCDSTADMGVRAARYFIANLNRYMSGEDLQHKVDTSAGY